jgi:thiopeptide-type bacteriocin biosynthesis protein
MIHAFHFLLVRTPLQSLVKAYGFKGKMEPVMEEGIYLSSSEFWAALQSRDKLNGKEKEKLELSFAKYWIRSCMRSTPFGTFAGSAIARISDEEGTDIILNGCGKHIRRLRLDTNYITEIIQALVKMPSIREQVKFYTNNTIYELPSGFRYVEYSIRNNTRFYDLNSVARTGYLKAVFDRAKNGARIDELIEVLNVSEGGEQEEARAFIYSLQESQLLISGLEPSLTGPEPIEQLIGELEKLKGVEELLGHLHKVKKEIESPKEGVGRYQIIEEELKQMGVALIIPKDTLQADMFLSLQKNHISGELVRAITSQCEDLFALSVQINNAELTSFRERFYARYEEMEIPLAIALDSELGIGYAGNRDGVVSGSDFIDDLIVGGKSVSELREVNYIQGFAISKYHEWLDNKNSWIEITADELKGFSKQVTDYQFPVSMYLMGSLLKINGKLGPTDFQFDLETFSGPSAANLLGRFTHGNEELCTFTREIINKEERQSPDDLFAEIVHLPQARTGNILLRPVLRDYEIPYVAVSGASRENQIPISDLMVSIRDGQVILRSKMHNKRVIPRLTTAHNFGRHGLPVYKFLCDLQSQGMARPNIWDWGQLGLLKRLPRVIYKNLIIAKARWRIEEGDLMDLPEKKERIEYFKKFRLELKMTNPVCYNEDGNKLLIDFEQEKGIELFLHYLHRYKNILLEEFLFTEENCIVRDTKGAPFTNELIIPVYRETPARQGFAEKKPVDLHPVKRKFLPISEWLYFKIYTGQKSAEKLLKTCVAKFVESEPGKTMFEKFFFIRFRDDSSHLRIRFYNPDVSRQAPLQMMFLERLQPLMDDGTIDKIVMDTYSRELERYGADLIQESESLFYNDSLAVLRFISLLEGEEEEKYRILFALRGTDMLLNDFAFSFSDKQLLAKRIQAAYFKEFGSEPALQKQLNEKYRKYQKDIFSHMDPERDALNEISEGVSIFRTRSEMNRPVIDSVISKLPEQTWSGRKADWLPSLIHMNMNRLFLGNQRKYELVVYHFLERYYTSMEAILKIKS